MNFQVVYLLIPTILFLLKPIKPNKILVFYWAAVCVLSYDNVTDFSFYYNEFFSIYNHSTSFYIEKGREIGWTYLVNMFSFTKYGLVIIHTIVLLLVVFQYFQCSKKIGILNISILLYFVCNLIWKHDNVLRQDIAIVVAYYGFFKFIEAESINKSQLIMLCVIVISAMIFHSSGIILIPIFFWVRWMSRVDLKFIYVFPIVIGFTIFFSLSGINAILDVFTVYFSAYNTDTSSYYLKFLSSDIENTMSYYSLVWVSLSTVPLFYYNYINRKPYEENVILRACVNICWFVATWRICFVNDLLRRPTDYLLWFQVWGYAYFLRDALLKKPKCRYILTKCIAFCFVALIYIQEYRFIDSYYGDNNYMTVFTKECKDMQIYTRSLVEGEAKNHKRIRR